MQRAFYLNQELEVTSKIIENWNLESKRLLIEKFSVEEKEDFKKFYSLVSSFLNKKEQQVQWINMPHFSYTKSLIDFITNTPVKIKEINCEIERLMNP